MYKGNYLMRELPVLDDKTPNLFFISLINALTDRVFTDVYLGSGVPDVDLGQPTDVYINLAALTYYTKSSTGWGASTAIDNNANAVLLISSKR